MSPPAHPVVLFDGVCVVCDGAVQFIIRRDPGARFQFASLQSEAGRQLAAHHGVDVSTLDTLVLIDGEQARVMSDAVLGIARYLGRPWSWATGFAVVPRRVRDAAYRVVARNRTRLFGRRGACRIPTPDLRSRFLDL